MPQQQNIFLVGPMGAGKTTIGKTLSELTNLPFYDSDAVIEERTGANIPWIFDVEGESGFRKREQDVIEDLTKLNGIILATGGGAVKTLQNRTVLVKRGVVVYLDTSPEEQFARTGRDRRRPLINNEHPLETLRKLYQERDPLYREVSDIIVTTDNISAYALAKNILAEIEHLKEK